MATLVFNAGSSSLKYKLYTTTTLRLIAEGKVDCLGKNFTKCVIEHDFPDETTKQSRDTKATTHASAAKIIIEDLQKQGIIKNKKDITAVGHRVVHGGEAYTKPTRITKHVRRTIKNLSHIAPLHNPANLSVIEAAQSIFPRAPHIAVFDTAFHHTIPKEAFLYAIPIELYQKDGIRKYGFHGISHQYVAKAVASHTRKKNLKIISCHLGNGSSVTAIAGNKSIDTSMGFSPLDGLIMGTRSGEIDPEIIFYLIRKKRMKPKAIEEMLNHKSGLLGLSGYSDVRDLRTRYEQGQKQADFTLQMLAYRISKYIGSYMAVLGGIDVIAFTGGIGEHGYHVRELVMERLRFTGLTYSKRANNNHHTELHTPKSPVKALIIPANEELEIASEVRKILS